MGLKVGQEASFAVQLNGARGLIDAKIHTPSGAIEECYITELDSGKTYYCVLELFSERHSHDTMLHIEYHKAWIWAYCVLLSYLKPVLQVWAHYL